MKQPLVSIVFSVYNGAQYLSSMLESIRAQTYQQYEIIAVDDGSEDGSRALLEAYPRERITILRHENNCGLTASLNEAMRFARGTYIARIDADDQCMPQRLERQVLWMEEHPEVGVCGSFAHCVGNAHGSMTCPTTHEEIVCELLFGNVLIHPSVMMRRSLFDHMPFVYNPECHYGEDFELWCRLSSHTHFGMIPEALISYRVHAAQKTATYADVHVEHVYSEVMRTFDIFFKRLGITPDSHEKELHYAISSIQGKKNVRVNSKDLHAWLYRLQERNAETCVFPEPLFSKMLALQWIRLGVSAHEKRVVGNREHAAHWLSYIAIEKGATLREAYHAASLSKQVGFYEDAKRIFTRIVSDDSQSFPSAYFHLADIAMQAGQHREACYLLEKCLLLEPHHRKARDLQDAIQRAGKERIEVL